MNLLPGKPSRLSGSPSSSKRRTLNWRPRTSEEIARKRNRNVVSQHLKRIGKAAGREMTLDEDGVCVFSFKRFVIVVEVPEDHSSIVSFRSKISQLHSQDNVAEVERFLGAFNNRYSSRDLTADASSASESTCAVADPIGPKMRLVLKDREVELLTHLPIQGLSFANMADRLEQFVKTSIAANRRLSKLKALPSRASPKSASTQPNDTALNDSSNGRSRVESVDSQCSISNLSQCSIFGLFASNSRIAAQNDLSDTASE